MNFYAITRRRYDTILHPDHPESDKQLPLYSVRGKPMSRGAVYRYTVGIEDLRRSSVEDDAFQDLEKQFHQEVRREGSGIECRRLVSPVVYKEREKWNGTAFVADDEVGGWRRWKAKAALAIFSAELPVDEHELKPASTLFERRVEKGASIVGTSGSWTANHAVLTLGRDGDLKIHGTLQDGGSSLEALPDGHHELAACLEDGTQVRCEEAYFREADIVPMPGVERRFVLTPKVVEVGRKGTGAPSHTILLVRRVGQLWWPLSFDVEGRKIEVSPLRGTANKDYAGWVTVHGLPSDSEDEAEVIGVAVARLLSLVHRARTPVVAIRKLWPGCEFTSLNGNTWADTPNPLVPASEVKSFLEQALPVYLAQNVSHRLFALAEYYVRSFVEDTAEHRFTFASIFMEAFKFSWAVNDTSTDVVVDYKANGLVRGFQHPPPPGATGKRAKKGTPWTFIDLVRRYAGSIEGASGFTFVDNRNALFHTGLSVAAQIHGATGGSYVFLKPEFEKLQVQMEDVLLHVILGYSGRIYEYGKAEGEVAYPGRTPIP